MRRDERLGGVWASWRRVDMYRINKSYHVKTDHKSSRSARKFRAPCITHNWQGKLRFDPNSGVEKLNYARTTIDKARDALEEVELLY